MMDKQSRQQDERHAWFRHAHHIGRYARLLPLALALLETATVSAANATWNLNSNGSWVTGANWSPSSAPGSTVATTSPDTATFGTIISAARVITVDTNRNIFGINFSGNSFGYTLSGGNLLLTSGGLIQTSGAGAAHTDAINSPLQIQGDGGTATFAANSTTATHVLTIGGGVTGVSTGLNVTSLTLSGANTGSNSVSGVIGDGSGGGTLKLIKSGAGLWSLSANNTFTGGVEINGGILALAGASSAATLARDAANTVTVNNGGTLRFDASNKFQNNSNVPVIPLVINAGGVATTVTDFIFNPIGSLTLNGGTLTSSAAINGTTGSNYALMSTVTVGGSSLSTISATTLNLGSGPATGAVFNVADSVAGAATDLLVSAVLTNGRVGGTGTVQAGSLTKNGVGTMELSAVNTFTGGVTINGGTLLLSGASSSATLARDAANIVTVNSGGTLLFGQSNKFQTNSVVPVIPLVVNSGGVATTTANSIFNPLGSLTLGGGTLTSTGTVNSATGSKYALMGTVTVGGSNLSTISGMAINLGSGPSSGTTFDVADSVAGSATDLLVSAPLIDGRVGGTSTVQAGSLTKNGAGTMELTAANTFTGGTTVNAGTLLVNNLSGSGLGTGSVSVASGATIGGNGTVTGASQISGAISPGNSIGTLTMGDQTWNDGGSFVFEIASATGAPGVDWDLLVLDGDLLLAGLADFTIDIRSAGLTDLSVGEYSWKFVEADTIPVFSPDVFNFSVTGINTVGSAGNGVFSVSQIGNDLYLNYTAAVPEPPSLLLMSLALFITLAVAWRTRAAKHSKA